MESVDNELFTSSDFEPAGEPNLVKPFTTQDPRSHNGYFFNPALFDNTLIAGAGGAQCTTAPVVDPTGVPCGTIGTSPRTVCCGPGINDFDLSLLKTTPLTERVRMEFRAEFFNAFNHTQFIGVQGDISQGVQFGKVLRARDPRDIQFALKFIF